MSGGARVFARWEWAAFAALFVVAASVRLQLVDADYFSDEPMSYALSRHGFSTPAHVFEVDGSPTFHYPKSWYLERPGFYLMMMPAAMISFTAYRVEYILGAALLAPLAVALPRVLGVRPAFAYPVGLAVALHPQFVVWGTITHMDSPMTAALAGGLLASLRGRHRLAGALFTLAVWIKDTAMPFLVILFLAEMLRDTWRRRRLPWPLDLDGYRTSLFIGILLGFLPLLLAQEMLFGLPGERVAGRTREIVDGLFLTLWLLPLVLLGLLWPRSRTPSVWALALPAFYLPLHWVLDWNVREWYFVGSAFFTLVAAATALDEAWTRWRQPHASLRLAAGAIGAVALILVAALIVQPDSPEKRQLANPLSRLAAHSLEESLERERVRDLNGRGLLAAIRDAAPPHALLVDVHYAFVQHPIPTFVTDLRSVDSNEFGGRLEFTRHFADAAETYANLTVVQKRDSHPNEAIRRVYADCVVRDEPIFVFLDARQCPGRFEALYRELALLEAA